MEDDLEAAAAIDSEQCDRLDTHTVTNLSEPDLSVEASVHERLTESTQANVSQGKVIHCDTDSSSGETEGADSLDEFSSDSEYDEWISHIYYPEFSFQICCKGKLAQRLVYWICSYVVTHLYILEYMQEISSGHFCI